MEDGLAVTLNHMADCLSKDEMRTLHFLCSDLIPSRCRVGDDLKGALLLLAQDLGNNQATRMILMELMFHLKRFDILKKVLGTSRQEVENMLKNRQFLSGYRVLMTDLSEDLACDELHSMVFLFSGKLPRGKLDKTLSFLDLVDELEKLDEVSPEKMDLIEQGFLNIHRVDLAKKIQKFRGKGITTKCPEQMVLKTLERGVGSPTSPSQGGSSVCPSVQTSGPSPGLRPPVPETRVHHQQASEEYTMETVPYGVCVIIDCVGCDGDMLKQTFERLRFRVILHTLLCLEDTHNILRQLSQSQDLRGSSAFICCLLSRGWETSMLATEPHGPGLRLDTIRQLFESQNCPQLMGKPKLFFVQIYKVQEAPMCASRVDECLETDGGGSLSRWQTDAMKTIPVSADVLTCLCLTDAQVLERTGHTSTYWQVIRSTLLKICGRRISLLSALTEVNRVVLQLGTRNSAESYQINLSHTLRKNLYL